MKLSLLLAAVFCFSGCFECVIATHSYSEKISFSPEKKQYEIGDTIWLSSKFACTGLLNLTTGQTENFCDASNLGTNLGIIFMSQDSGGIIVGGADRFDYFSVEGEVFSDPKIQPERYKQIWFQEQNNEYSIRIGIIPLVVGTYGLFPGNAANIIQNGHRKCEDRAGFDFKLTNLDRHIELYEDFLDASEPSDYEREHGYFFEVVQ